MEAKRLFLKGLLGEIRLVSIVAVILLVAAGRIDWWMAWTYLGTLLGCLALNHAVLSKVSPELLEERIGGRKSAKNWDRMIAPLMVAAWSSVLIVAGLDERLGWSPLIPLGLQLAPLCLLVLGNLLSLWAMTSNKYYSLLVRIQEDREHHVINTGPYKYVRHPGYLGWIIATIPIPLALGSLWAFVPLAIATGLMLIRTALEDATLLQELEGYKDYTFRVRHRLFPGVW